MGKRGYRGSGDEGPTEAQQLECVDLSARSRGTLPWGASDDRGRCRRALSPTSALFDTFREAPPNLKVAWKNGMPRLAARMKRWREMIATSPLSVASRDALAIARTFIALPPPPPPNMLQSSSESLAETVPQKNTPVSRKGRLSSLRVKVLWCAYGFASHREKWGPLHAPTVAVYSARDNAHNAPPSLEIPQS